MMPTTAIKSSVVPAVKISEVVPTSIATVMCAIVALTMPVEVRPIDELRWIESCIVEGDLLPRPHRLN